MLIFHSPAKINLSLDVLSRRDDGYHELESVVHTVGLFDTISLDVAGSPGISLRCSVPAIGGDDNLCLRAARAWLAAADAVAGKRSYFPGIRITLDKRIPAGAGLGGGSGNAAGTLAALNAYFDKPLDDTKLQSIATRLGADVPLFLSGGCQLMEGIGERLTTLPALEGWTVLIHPPQHASTPEVYRRLDESEIPSARSTAAVVEAVQSDNLEEVGEALSNDLAAAAAELGVEVELPTWLLKKYGALGASLSGSGSASFGLFATEAAAEATAAILRSGNELPKDYTVYVAPLIPYGVRQLS